MKKIQLDILGLSTNPYGNEYALVLFEIGGERKLPILIGQLEAQAIAMRLENQTLMRPSTHDLLFNMLNEFSIAVTEVVIDALHKDMFYAKIVCEQNGTTRQIDARPSDAVAVALRTNSPIFVLESVLEIAGVSDENSNNPIKEQKKETVNPKNASADISKLQAKLKEAIDNEDYEKAARLRDEIIKTRAGL